MTFILVACFLWWLITLAIGFGIGYVVAANKYDGFGVYDPGPPGLPEPVEDDEDAKYIEATVVQESRTVIDAAHRFRKE